MKSVRLLPIVIAATLALLVLKGIGLMTNGSYVLTGTTVAQAQSQPEPAPDMTMQAEDDAGFSEDAINAADRASETLFERAAPAPLSSSQIDAIPVTENKAGDKIAIGSSDSINETERAVLERLTERRTSLDQLATDLEARRLVVEAAEQRLAERIEGLEAIEARIAALVDERKAQDDAQFAALVNMYENMKPRDAAEIFNDLEMDVLLRVAQAMNPRKMSPIMAGMATEKAQDLTLLLAEFEPEPSLDAPVDDLEDLPQIVGE